MEENISSLLRSAKGEEFPDFRRFEGGGGGGLMIGRPPALLTCGTSWKYKCKDYILVSFPVNK